VSQAFTLTVVLAPVARDDDAYSMYGSDISTTLTVLATSGVLRNDTDPMGLPLHAVLVTLPTYIGTAARGFRLNRDGSFIYVAPAGFRGQDSFTYLARDAYGDSNVATVTITVE
jgi:Bacterial Ig domain